MMKNKCEIYEITHTSDDYGNPVIENAKTGAFWSDYIMPISFDELRDTFNMQNDTSITFKTITRTKRQHNETFICRDVKYRIEKMLVFPNGIHHLFLEVVQDDSNFI